MPTGFDFSSYGGESLEHLGLRIKAFSNEIRTNEPEALNIMIVAHSGCLGVFLCVLLGIDIVEWWRFSVAPASLTIIEETLQKPVLTLLNDVSHLNI
jgi:broad specificity phosphatase PhoE